MRFISLKHLYFCASICLNFSLAQLTVNENFTTGVVKNNWIISGNTCLTTGLANNGIPGCTLSQGGGKKGVLPDKIGEAALRFTGTQQAEKGSIVYRDSFSTDKGIRITFITHVYSVTGEEGDGMSFFLLDADIGNGKLLGSTGGALGYTCYNSKDKTNTEDGIEGGYLGIGMDTYGNFFNKLLLTSSGEDGRRPDSIVVRGGGNLNATISKKYTTPVMDICKTGRAITTSGQTVDLLNYPVIQALKMQSLGMHDMFLSDREDKRTKFMKYELEITQKGILSLSFSKNGRPKIMVISGFDVTKSSKLLPPLPRAFRFGFAASTGLATNFHEISCFKAETEASSNDSSTNIIDGEKLISGSQIYLGSYLPGYWSGNLNAYSFVINKLTSQPDIASNANWNASCTLTGGPCPAMGVDNLGNAVKHITKQEPSKRTILTRTNEGIPFRWDNLNSAQQVFLNKNKNGTIDQLGKTRVDYLRGVRINENTLRKRISVLGDIIDSGPTWVAAPDNNNYAKPWKDNLYPNQTLNEKGYIAYQLEYKERTHIAYVGSNDGMLHGFRAGKNDANDKYLDNLNDGEELLAYVPNYLIPKLNLYMDKSYGHEYYANFTPGKGDLYYNDEWHTWLVSGLGAGGKAIFALDITNPNKFSENNAQMIVKGEWDQASLLNLGDTFGTPTITRMHDGRWAVIFGNGFDSAQGIAGVYMLLVDSNGKIESKWLSTESGTAANKNGIAHVTPADLDDDNITDYLYAGDLFGNIWRFDVTSNNSNDWQVSKFGSTRARPLFSGAGGQPITTKVLFYKANVIKDKAPKLLIIAGTGRKKPFTINQASMYEQAVQSLYGVWDWDVASLSSDKNKLDFLPAGNGIMVMRKDLKEQTITAVEEITNGTIKAYRSLSSNEVCWTGTSICASNNYNYGWYLDFKVGNKLGKEQIIFNPIIYRDVVFVNSIVTENISNKLMCDTFKPSGWTMSFNALTGGALEEPIFKNDKGNFEPMDSLKEHGSNGNAMGIETGGTGSIGFITHNNETYMYTAIDKDATIVQLNFKGKPVPKPDNEPKTKPQRLYLYKRI